MKKSKPIKRYSLTETQLNKVVNDAKLETIQKMMILFAAYMMEEPELNCSDERILDMWDGLNRYCGYIDDKMITVNKVCGIIRDHTGLDIKWKETKKFI